MTTAARRGGGEPGYFAAVALVALALSGPACRAQTDDTTVATVNAHEILLSDVYDFIESFPLGEQIPMRQRLDLVIQSLVHEELLFQSLLRSDGEWETRVRAEIKSQVADRVIEKYVREQAVVSDEEIRAYYHANRETLQRRHVRVSHIRLRSKGECEAMMRQIDGDEAFERMAIEHSLDRLSADKGGDLGYLMYSPDNPQSLGFEHEFFEMDMGEMRVFESPKGCHLIRVTDIDDPEEPEFDRLREFLKPRLEAQKASELLSSLIENASKGANITITAPVSP